MTNEDNTPVTDSPSPEKWMVWYQDDTISPIGVRAPTRTDARRVGQKARPGELVTAAVREDEGAARDLDGISDTELSTIDNPRRFIDTRP